MYVIQQLPHSRSRLYPIAAAFLPAYHRMPRMFLTRGAHRSIASRITSSNGLTRVGRPFIWLRVNNAEHISHFSGRRHTREITERTIRIVVIRFVLIDLPFQERNIFGEFWFQLNFFLLFSIFFSFVRHCFTLGEKLIFHEWNHWRIWPTFFVTNLIFFILSREKNVLRYWQWVVRNFKLFSFLSLFLFVFVAWQFSFLRVHCEIMGIYCK